MFYYLLSAASTPAEREFLSLQAPEKYTLLARSGTYSPPSYLPTADDSAAAEDFRANLRAIGIKGAALRGMLSILAGILKLGNGVGLLVDEEVVEEVCEEVAGLLGVEPEILSKKLGDGERELLIEVIYEALVDWVIARANEAVAEEFVEINKRTLEVTGSDEGGDTVQVTVLELPDEKMAKALCLRGVFDDETGINSEMKVDGIELLSVTSSVLRELKSAVSEADKEGFLGMTREKEYARDRREGIVEKVGREADEDSFLSNILFSEKYQRQDVGQLLAASRVWWHLSVCPSEGGSDPNMNAAIGAWSAAVVSRQLRSWRLPEWANRRAKHLDFTADFDVDEFCQRYAILGCSNGKDGVESWILERGWSNGEVVVGSERVWMREGAWWEAEQMLDLKPGNGMMGMGMNTPGYFNMSAQGVPSPNSQDQFFGQPNMHGGHMAGTSVAQVTTPASESRGLLGQKYPEDHPELQDKLDPELGKNKKIETRPITRGRKIWVTVVWALTFWIPSFVLKYIGRMARPDVRMAWREKLVLCFAIAFANGLIIFWIIWFAILLCPEYNKVWNRDEVSTHTGRDDFWVSIHGTVYDISKYYT